VIVRARRWSALQVLLATVVIGVLGVLAVVSRAPGFVVAALAVAVVAVRAWRVRLEVRDGHLVVANVWWTRRLERDEVATVRWHATQQAPWVQPTKGVLVHSGSADALDIVVAAGARPVRPTVLRVGSRAVRRDAARLLAGWLGRPTPTLTYDDHWLGPDVAPSAVRPTPPGPRPPSAP
jgi:hypothetical protein